MHVHFESLYTGKKVIVLMVENMKEASPETSSHPNNFTFHCCKSTMFILQTCFISLSFFCLVFWCVWGVFYPSPTRTESVFGISWAVVR